LEGIELQKLFYENQKLFSRIAREKMFRLIPNQDVYKKILKIKSLSIQDSSTDISFLIHLKDLFLLWMNNLGMDKVPPIIYKLNNLRELNMSGNLLSVIDPEFENLTKIQDIYLSRNNLRTVEINFEKLLEIELLNFRQNELFALPNDICLLSKLKYLNVSRNQLDNLPVDFYKLKSLEILDISYTKIRLDFGLLAEFEKLKEIRIKGSPISYRKLERYLRSKAIKITIKGGMV